MILGVSYETFAAYIFIFILGVLLLAVLASPLKKLFKVLVGCVAGTAGMLIFNLIGHFLNFTVGINPASILTVGILGIPGFILIVFLKFFLS